MLVLKDIAHQRNKIISSTRSISYQRRESEFQRVTMYEFQEYNDADIMGTRGYNRLDFLWVVIASRCNNEVPSYLLLPLAKRYEELLYRVLQN